MLLSHELLGQQLRQLYIREWHSVSAILQSRRHCWQSVGRRGARYPGGEEARLVHLEQLQLKSDLPYGPNSTEDSTLVVPLYHMWMRLHSIEPNSTVSNPLYSICRLRLEQQSLQQNLCRVVSILWNRCFLKFCGGPQFVDAITQTAKAQLTTAIKKRNWLQDLVFGFLSITEKLEQALIPVNPNLRYAYQSAAMEMINLRDINTRLNYALVDYIVNNDEQLKDIFQTGHDAVVSKNK
ncbi:PREDICTED: uncharacterized protein LOC108614493 isoform X1 [Drosophila arizonae]|uniref:Uncharacterized protein LOC108614493 isoform X1 n=1 Tax=Drosophila arizonae TaxID=7263 RepID=A0ABM1PAA2_DROAR|nr:PREDICTED: uncharacterized protein LOC108614493 isoform X1 [Drosophila arizonae]